MARKQNVQRVILLTMACAGCGAAEAPQPQSVTDSAGVRIVENGAPLWSGEGDEWVLSEKPAVVIGTTAGDEAYMFDRVMGLERLSSGEWVVADMGSSQLRFYDAAGRHVRSVGRAGEGPGEFRQVMGLHRLAGDTLAVNDSHIRYQLFTRDGEFIAATIPPDQPFLDVTPIGALDDGTLIAADDTPFPQQITTPQALHRTLRRAEFKRDASGSAELVLGDTIHSWAMMQFTPGWRSTPQDVKFTEWVRGDLLGDGIAIGDPQRNEIRTYGGDGTLRSIVRTAAARLPVTEDDRKLMRERFIHGTSRELPEVSQRMIQQRMDIADSWTYSDSMPAFSSIRADDAGNLWVNAFSANAETVGEWRRAPAAPSKWTVYNRDGLLLGSVDLPARFAPMVFGKEHIAGLYRDDMDVEYIHIYRLQKR